MLLLPGAAPLCVLATLAGGNEGNHASPREQPGAQTAATPPPCMPPRRTGREVPGAKAGEGELGAARERLQRLTSGLSGRKRISRQLWNAAMPSYWNYIPRPWPKLLPNLHQQWNLPARKTLAFIKIDQP